MNDSIQGSRGLRANERYWSGEMPPGIDVVAPVSSTCKRKLNNGNALE